MNILLFLGILEKKYRKVPIKYPSFIKFIFAFFFLTGILFPSFAQETVVKGKVTDAQTGEALPFANIYFNNTQIGVTSDFDGFFTIKTTQHVDSVTATFMGYSLKTKPVTKGITQNIDFQLSPEDVNMEEVVLTVYENPAWAIMRNVVKNKKKNDNKTLTAYEYESFSKTEVSIDNISQKLQDKKVMREIAKVYDSLKTKAGEDGKPVLPVFISEAISNYYHRTDPDKSKEVIVGTKISGVGITDGSFVSQFMGSSFHEYNFYKNWLSVVNKDIVSPIADEWQGYYKYKLIDSAFIGSKWCYKIEFKPIRSQDLAFTGSMWINDSTFAIQQIEATLDKRANINYLDKIQIQQELWQSPAGPWLPLKTRILVDIAEIKKNSAGLLVKLYTSNKYFNINSPRPPEFYDELLVVNEDAKVKENEFWDQHRQDSLTSTDKYVYSMIDSIKSVPIVKTYTEILNVVVNGYKKVGPIDLGPYLYTYANNNIEGHRIRVGFKTNIDFSRKWIIKGYGAYGTKDNHFKYGAEINYILSRNNWTVIGIERRHDIDQLGLSRDVLYNTNNNLFLAYANWGTLRAPYYTTQNVVSFKRNYTKDFSQKIILKTRSFEKPMFPFAYYKDPSRKDSSIGTEFNVSEIEIVSRYAKDELFFQDDNDRISLGTKKWPIITLGYTLGLKGALGGQFNYQKLAFDVSGIIRWGAIGRTYYDINMGKIFGQIPYPLLRVHLGNQSPFYTTAAFNLMRYFEFLSDTYASLKYRHYFEGLFFNRIPLIKKLKWRFLTTGGMVYGSVSKKNLDDIPSAVVNGRNSPMFSTLAGKPYIELGYGIENIFKVLRVDFFHRITYRDSPNAKNFGVKFSFQFIL